MKAIIKGTRYADFKDYGWNPQEICRQKWEIEAGSTHEAELWLATNHPEYYMGCNIKLDNGAFYMTAVPCSEYGEGHYETEEARVAFVRDVIRKELMMDLV